MIDIEKLENDMLGVVSKGPHAFVKKSAMNDFIKMLIAHINKQQQQIDALKNELTTHKQPGEPLPDDQVSKLTGSDLHSYLRQRLEAFSKNSINILTKLEFSMCTEEQKILFFKYCYSTDN